MMLLLLLYPKHAPVTSIVGSDLAHAVLITAIAGSWPRTCIGLGQLQPAGLRCCWEHCLASGSAAVSAFRLGIRSGAEARGGLLAAAGWRHDPVRRPSPRRHQAHPATVAAASSIGRRRCGFCLRNRLDPPMAPMSARCHPTPLPAIFPVFLRLRGNRVLVVVRRSGGAQDPFAAARRAAHRGGGQPCSTPNWKPAGRRRQHSACGAGEFTPGAGMPAADWSIAATDDRRSTASWRRRPMRRKCRGRIVD